MKEGVCFIVFYFNITQKIDVDVVPNSYLIYTVMTTLSDFCKCLWCTTVEGDEGDIVYVNKDNSISVVHTPNVRHYILFTFVMYVAMWTYPTFGLVAELFCGYICCVLLIAYITYALIAIACYMLHEININYKPILRPHKNRSGDGGGLGGSSVPQLRHNAKVGGGAQFRGRRDLCGEITLRAGQ